MQLPTQSPGARSISKRPPLRWRPKSKQPRLLSSCKGWQRKQVVLYPTPLSQPATLHEMRRHQQPEGQRLAAAPLAVLVEHPLVG